MAVPAGNSGFEGDAVVWGKVRYVGAGGEDCARGFVAHCYAGGGQGFAYAAVVPEVYLCGVNIWVSSSFLGDSGGR